MTDCECQKQDAYDWDDDGPDVCPKCGRPSASEDFIRGLALVAIVLAGLGAVGLLLCR